MCLTERFYTSDAVGFLWKEPGTNCMHLKQTHAIVKLLRAVLDEVLPVRLSLPKQIKFLEENITYLGNGDEAHMDFISSLCPVDNVYPPERKRSETQSVGKVFESTRLNEYNTYLNFLASHDGIGLRPVEGILDEDEKELLIRTVIENGGRISYKTNKDGSTSPYELNINYMDGITNSSKPKEERFLRFIAAQAIMLSLKGIPGIYYHSLLGSENWIEGVETSGINRRINRQKLDYNSLTEQLEDKSSLRNMVLNAHKKILEVRSRHSAFSPFAHQKVLDISPSIFALERYNPDTKEKIIAMINVTDKPVKLNEPIKGIELLGSGNNETITQMKPYQVAWLLV